MSDDDLLDDMKEAGGNDGPDNQFQSNEEMEHEIVGMYYSDLEANMALARLRAEGIPAFLSNNHSQSVLTHLQILVRLHVRPQDIETAKLILADTGSANSWKKTKEPEWGIWIASAAIGLALLAAALKAC